MRYILARIACMSGVLITKKAGFGIASIVSVLFALDRYKYARFPEKYYSLRGNCALEG